MFQQVNTSRLDYTYPRVCAVLGANWALSVNNNCAFHRRSSCHVTAAGQHSDEGSAVSFELTGSIE